MPGLSCELMASSMPDAAVGGPTHLALRVHKLGGKGVSIKLHFKARALGEVIQHLVYGGAVGGLALRHLGS